MLAPLAARAVTDTWDGGGANDNLNPSANWVDGSAPASDLVNTDLIFAGVVRLNPNVSAGFSTHSVTLNNTAAVFTIEGLTLSVGTGGIDNKDAQTTAFTNVVSFSGVANATINAFAGGLTFTDTVSLPTSTLTVTGGFATTFRNFSKNTAIVKQGGGVMTWSPNADIEQEMTIADGTLSMGADGSADVFSSSSTIAVAGTSVFNINESLTLDGAQLTRSSGGDVNLAAGKTLAVQNGGDAVITGAFTNNTASIIVRRRRGLDLFHHVHPRARRRQHDERSGRRRHFRRRRRGGRRHKWQRHRDGKRERIEHERRQSRRRAQWRDGDTDV